MSNYSGWGGGPDTIPSNFWTETPDPADQARVVNMKRVEVTTSTRRIENMEGMKVKKVMKIPMIINTRRDKIKCCVQIDDKKFYSTEGTPKECVNDVTRAVAEVIDSDRIDLQLDGMPLFNVIDAVLRGENMQHLSGKAQLIIK